VNVPAIVIEMGGLSPGQIDLLRAVEDSGRLMVAMIDSSLDMLKMERGSYETRHVPVDLIQVLENVIHQNGVLIQRTSADVAIVVDGSAVTPETHIQVFSEKTNLYTMISNLVVTAIESSSEGEPVQLRVDTASPLTVSIVNNGTVPVAIRDRFFEKFATFGKKKGTGLGTYSAKLIADTFGYAIDMNTSDETNQTTVTITMHGAGSHAVRKLSNRGQRKAELLRAGKHRHGAHCQFNLQLALSGPEPGQLRECVEMGVSAVQHHVMLNNKSRNPEVISRYRRSLRAKLAVQVSIVPRGIHGR